jgi:hypothetical protein
MRRLQSRIYTNMRKETYNHQTINAYLLGSLPEDETERLDELSFTDDEFADELKAAEKDLVDAYVNGELTDATREKFEAFYLASPLRREKVKFAQAFQVYAEKNVAQTEEEISPTEKSKPKQRGGGFFSAWLHFFANPRPLLQWGLAPVTLAFLFFGGWLFLENLRLRREMSDAQERRLELQQRQQQLQEEIAGQRTVNSEKEEELLRVRGEIARLEQEQEKERKRVTELEQEQKRMTAEQRAGTEKQSSSPGRISIASFILPAPIRDIKSMPTVAVPAQTDAVAMQLELESDNNPAYRVALRSQGGQIIWRSGRLKTKTRGENKVLNVRFPARLLKTQIYSLVVSGAAADGTVEDISSYPFRAVLN